jgi:hypothetical protein
MTAHHADKSGYLAIAALRQRRGTFRFTGSLRTVTYTPGEIMVPEGVARAVTAAAEADAGRLRFAAVPSSCSTGRRIIGSGSVTGYSRTASSRRSSGTSSVLLQRLLS